MPSFMFEAGHERNISFHTLAAKPLCFPMVPGQLVWRVTEPSLLFCFCCFTLLPTIPIIRVFPKYIFSKLNWGYHPSLAGFGFEW
jgi:hypothetical protein